MYLGKQQNPYSQTTHYPTNKKGKLEDKKISKQTIEQLIHNNSY